MLFDFYRTGNDYPASCGFDLRLDRELKYSFREDSSVSARTLAQHHVLIGNRTLFAIGDASIEYSSENR